MKTIEELNEINKLQKNVSQVEDVNGLLNEEIKRLKEENTWLLEELTVQKNVRISFENAHKKLLEEKAKLIEENKNLIQAISDIRQRT